jgi:hypothetical protein
MAKEFDWLKRQSFWPVSKGSGLRASAVANLRREIGIKYRQLKKFPRQTDQCLCQKVADHIIESEFRTLPRAVRRWTL